MQTASVKILRNAALASALIAGGMVLPHAATAGSVHRHGDFGGTWTYIGPTDQEDRLYAGRYYDYSGPVFIAPSYAYGPDFYEPEFLAPPAYEGPGIAFVGPGVGLLPEID